MADQESAGARWFREDKERRAKEAADAERERRRKALDIVARARAAQARARQDAFAAPATPAEEERTLLERILAASEPRLRERLEAELSGLRARAKRGGDARGTAVRAARRDDPKRRG